ncbi:MAG: DsbA family protein [Nitrospirales bacterium]|nr:DsbA family protein [Nitrospirales bacterium]
MKAGSLICVVDPMCSWCWGFSPILDAIVQRYQRLVPIHMMLGGLRPGNTKPFDADKRAYILHHWRAVYERTRQPFNFTFRMPSDFTYDTEPPSRAVKVVRQLVPTLEFVYLKAVQEAFYVKNRDVTCGIVLREIAESLEVDPVQFSELFQDPQIKNETWGEFAQAREWGVDGFPTILGRHSMGRSILMHGYQDLDQLTPIIDSWLTCGNEIST